MPAINIKPFIQTSGMCGPTVLRMVFDFYGLIMSEEELINLTHCDPNIGIEAETMAKVSNELGFKTIIKDNATFDDLREYVVDKKIPIIVDWFSEDDGHYSVVVDIDSQNIYLQNPEFKEIQKIPLDKFKRVWFDFRGDFIGSKEDMIIRRVIAIYK